MANTPKAEEGFFHIEADSIVTFPTGEGISKLVLFKPSEHTMRNLRSFTEGQILGKLRLIDKWDDGTQDVHLGSVKQSFIALKGSGSGRKTHTWILVVIDHTFFNAIAHEHSAKKSKETSRFDALPDHGVRHG